MTSGIEDHNTNVVYEVDDCGDWWWMIVPLSTSSSLEPFKHGPFSIRALAMKDRETLYEKLINMVSHLGIKK